MFSENQVRLILIEEFAEAQARHPGHSMRAFAKRVGISQAAMSQIISAKRPISSKAAEAILKGLNKSPVEIERILNPESLNEAKFRSIDMDSFQLIADWHHYAILSLAETKTFRGTPAWIGKRLGISVKVAEESIERLLRLGMLERNPKSGKLQVTGEQFEALSEIANPALKKACRQNLELAQQALDESKFEERDFTAITLCFDPDRMKQAKEMIKNFRRNFCRTMEAYPKKQVYKLTVQLFPLSKRGTE